MIVIGKTIMAIPMLAILIFSAPQSESRFGEWMRDWLLCGPFQLQTLPNNTPDGVHIPGFETDYLQAHGGETSPRVRAGQVETYAGGSATWIAHTAPEFSVNLDKAVSDKAFVLAYAYREFNWPREETVVLALGSNDGGRAWLNGERIWDRPEARCAPTVWSCGNR